MHKINSLTNQSFIKKVLHIPFVLLINVPPLSLLRNMKRRRVKYGISFFKYLFNYIMCFNFLVLIFCFLLDFDLFTRSLVMRSNDCVLRTHVSKSSLTDPNSNPIYITEVTKLHQLLGYYLRGWTIIQSYFKFRRGIDYWLVPRRHDLTRWIYFIHTWWDLRMVQIRGLQNVYMFSHSHWKPGKLFFNQLHLIESEKGQKMK